MLNGESSGYFNFAGARRGAGNPREASGFVHWLSRPDSDPVRGSDCAVPMRIYASLDWGEDAGGLPAAFGKGAPIEIPRSVLRGLGSDCENARNEILRMIGVDGMGFDFRAATDAWGVTKGSFFVMGRMDGNGSSERVAGCIEWAASPSRGGMRRARAAPGRSWKKTGRGGFTARMNVSACVVGGLVAMDFGARREIAAMVSGAEPGLKIHVPAV